MDEKNSIREKGDQEPFTISQELIESPDPQPAGTTQLTFDGLLSSPLELHEDLSEGCGGQLWPAGMVLAKYLLRRMDPAELADMTMFVRPCSVRPIVREKANDTSGVSVLNSVREVVWSVLRLRHRWCREMS